ncbi:alpha/beta fold hydrolase [Candidatus Uhrbacteria bacterium]|nr:alpha/beta fold hydrolase [Candidatus Uhrbacteria bacterium]
MKKSVSFITQDGVTVCGAYSVSDVGRPDRRGRRGAVLLHMMPAAKESWMSFEPYLIEAGFGVLTIDLRGHGQSVSGPNGQALDYRLFGDEEHMAKIRDVKAAVGWLSEEAGITLKNIGLVGASIGANLAIAYAGTHPELPAVAALSPGLNYHGLTTEDRVRMMGAGQKLFLAASREDDRSIAAVRELSGIRPEATVREFEGAGHGTELFGTNPEFMAELAGWISDMVPERAV